MGCAMGTVRYLLFFFNLVFALCGLAILISGALTYYNIDKANYVMEKVNNEVNFTASPIALMVVGSIIFVIAFFGCCGAIRKSWCMMITFAVILLVLLIVEIAIGIVVFVKMNGEGLEQLVNDSITEQFAHYNETHGAINTEINNFQRDLECCGVDGPNYWRDRGVQKPPPGCCVNPSGLCESFGEAQRQVFQTGCVNAVMQLLRNSGLWLGILAIAVGVVQIIGVIFALCLANSIRNEDRRVA